MDSIRDGTYHDGSGRRLSKLRQDVQESTFAGITGMWIHCYFQFNGAKDEWSDLVIKSRKDGREFTRAIVERGLSDRPCIVTERGNMVIVSQILEKHTYYHYKEEIANLKKEGVKAKLVVTPSLQ